MQTHLSSKPFITLEQTESLEPIAFATLLGHQQIQLFDDALQAQHHELLYDLVSDLSLVNNASILLKTAAHHGYSFVLSFVEHGGYVLDHLNKCLIIDNFGLDMDILGASDYYQAHLFISLIRGLRDIWHEIRMGGIYDILNPEDIMKIERFRAADIEAVTASICWSMRNEGYVELWRNLISGDDGDIAIAYMREGETTPDSLSGGKALRTAFKQWFTDHNRSDICDHQALEMMDLLLLENNGSGRVFGQHALNPTQISGLMALPDGMRYLCPMKNRLLSDMFYTSFGDDINQAHLFHIMREVASHMSFGVSFQNPDLASKIFPSESVLL